ncbi:MAG: AAA family ATPase [Pseudonocardiaceae bacterium]
MLIDRLDVVSPDDTSAWPFSVPAVRDIAERGLRLTSNLVVFIGANGSGKSTLLEAIAEAYGIDVRGGHGGRRYGSYLDKSPLGAALRLSRTAAGRRFTGRGGKGFFLRAETAFGMLAYMTEMGVSGYGEQPSWEVSHGESYLQAIQGRFTGSGLYLLDEAGTCRRGLGRRQRAVDRAGDRRRVRRIARLGARPAADQRRRSRIPAELCRLGSRRSQRVRAARRRARGDQRARQGALPRRRLRRRATA